jgi:hypothetical protein
MKRLRNIRLKIITGMATKNNEIETPPRKLIWSSLIVIAKTVKPKNIPSVETAVQSTDAGSK